MELAQIPGEADAHLFQHAGAARNPHHVGPQLRIGGDEGALDVDGRPGLLVRCSAEGRRNLDRIARAAHIGEIVGRALARTGAVLAPFIACEIDIGIDALRTLEGNTRRRAPRRPAIRGKTGLVLRPEAVHDEA